MQLPEHVTLCECGSAPVHDMTIPKWVFEQVGECFADCDCKPTEDASTDGQNLEGSKGMKYKIWIHIEQHEDGTDDYEDVGIPEQVIELDTAEEGYAFVSALVCFGQTYLAKHSYY